MAKLSSFRADTRINDGEWIDVGVGDEQFRIRTRGFTPRYRDKLNALRRQAAREANRKLQPGVPTFAPDALPPSADDRCQGQALAEECILDVSGLTNDDGVALTADEFRAMVADPEQYLALLVLAFGAASKVHAERQDEATDAGNASRGRSDAISTGAASANS